MFEIFDRLNQRQVEIIAGAVNKADNKKAGEILEKYGQENFNRHWLEYRNVTLPEVETERRRFI